MMDPTEDPPAKPPPSLERVLAEQANDAISQGADPAKATAMLGTMVAHLRAHPDIAQHGTDALAQGADPGQVAHKVWELASGAPQAPPTERPGLGERVLKGVGGAIGQVMHDPVGTAESLIVAPVKSAIDAVLTPEVGEHRTSAALSKGGNSSGRPIDTSAYDAEHGAQPKGARNIAGVQTAVNVALPGAAGFVEKRLGGAAAAATAGAMGGAAYSPDDPVAGALTGAILGGTAHGVVKGAPPIARGAVNGMGAIGEKVMDMAGRPEVSRPLVTVAGRPIGKIASVGERAAQLNDKALGVELPFMQSDKPLAPVDQSVQAQRVARGLKTSSPAAETTLRDALQPRADQAVERVISQAKELTGIKQGDAYTTHENLKATTTAEGDAAYGKVWNSPQGQSLVDLADEMATPAGQNAWARAKRMMANDGIRPTVKTIELAGEDSPELTKMLELGVPRDKALTALGDKAMTTPTRTVEVPTLQQAHYFKLALDDMKQPGFNTGPGEGGLGYNEAKSIHGVQKRALAKMDEASPDYAAARSQFADNKSIEKASTLGQEHWTRDPVESKALMDEMTPSEQKIYRDQAFDKWATRVENGPENVGKAQSKSLNTKRLRLLFPDDGEGFATFQEGLKHEAQMHATTQGVLGGSNTADKLADMAGMAGVTLPDVFRAARGNPFPLLKKGAMAVARKTGNTSFDRLATERAKQLVAGANGPVDPNIAALIRAHAAKRSAP